MGGKCVTTASPWPLRMLFKLKETVRRKIKIKESLFIYLGFYVAFNTVQVISRRVVGRAEETSTYSSSGFCTVNCRPMASNYQLSHLRPCRGSNPGLRGGRRECYHSATVAPKIKERAAELKKVLVILVEAFCCTCYHTNKTHISRLQRIENTLVNSATFPTPTTLAPHSVPYSV